MGKRSREQRRQRERADRAAGRYTPPRVSGATDSAHSSGSAYDGFFPPVADLVQGALHVCREGSEAQLGPFLDLLADPSSRPQVRARVDHAVADMVLHYLPLAWEYGWQPADVVRLVGRRLRDPHRQLAAAAIVVGHHAYPATQVDPRWSDQVRALADELAATRDGSPDPKGPSWVLRGGSSRREAIGSALRLCRFMGMLPRLPRLCALPGEGSSRGASSHHVDEGVLRRVRGLLAKAESTTFEEEAQALTAKAQELMARHAIDRAALAAETGDHQAPVGLRLSVDNPYAQAKAILLAKVAEANRCRAVWSDELGFTTVFGFLGDIEAVDLLYTSLLVQATASMTLLGSHRSSDGRSRTRSFRQSFLVSFAVRIGQRLRAAAEVAEGEAVGEHGASLLPVLASRQSAVDAEADAFFPETSNIRSSAPQNAAGWVAGHAAADLAALWGGAEVEEQAS